MFYFIAQNGLISRQPIRSNFYVYRLPERCLARCEIEVGNAPIGNGGLVHRRDFIVWLEHNDTKWDQKEGL